MDDMQQINQNPNSNQNPNANNMNQGERDIRTTNMCCWCIVMTVMAI